MESNPLELALVKRVVLFLLIYSTYTKISSDMYATHWNNRNYSQIIVSDTWNNLQLAKFVIINSNCTGTAENANSTYST